MNQLEERLEDITTPISVSVIGCVVNGPGEALISDLGLAGANRRSGLYINGERQKLRIDNEHIVEQLEEQVRNYVEKQQNEPKIDVKIVE
jgi:(E)-4-hydroxy-3-methylbut-2-enyl-diphosphate synthase